MNLLKLWIGLTAAAFVAALIWNFAPVLVPILLLAALLALVTAAIVRAARWLERRKPNGDLSPPPEHPAEHRRARRRSELPD